MSQRLTDISCQISNGPRSVFTLLPSQLTKKERHNWLLTGGPRIAFNGLLLIVGDLWVFVIG